MDGRKGDAKGVEKRMRRSLAIVVAAALAAVGASSASAKPEAVAGSQLNVYAAASLTAVFPTIDKKAKYNFAGSNQLAAQIRQGAPADVFAAASPKDPTALFNEGLVERPIVFAYNKLVVIVPRSNPANITSVYSLRKAGVKLVIGQAGLPIGDYTRVILKNLGISKAVLANVKSQEPDVKSIVGKVVLGEADAGIVYRTDVTPVENKVKFFRFPAWSQPPVRYMISVVKSSRNKAAARAFVKRVLGPIGRGNLSGAGFGLPPKK